MNVIYLTTHVEDADFVQACSRAERKPNPAGQNFHGKMIRCLAQTQNVHVFSLVPSSLGHLGKEQKRIDGHLLYSYAYAPKNKYIRALLFPASLAKRIGKEIGKAAAIIVYDSLNYLCAKTARLLSKKSGIKRIAILTDDMKNITGANASYCARILEEVQGTDGSISLTQGLVEAFGLQDKPTLIRPIYVESADEVAPYDFPKPYIYYGGALFEKDGTKDLIDAFNELPMGYDLILAGHGAYEEKAELAAKENPRIHYLGQVDKKTHYALIRGSALAINPRHYRKELDECAVPSKVMEYLTYATYVASTLSTPIQEAFPADVNWFEGSLFDFFKSHLDEEGTLIGLRQNKARKQVERLFGQEESARVLRSFLSNF